MSIEIVVEGQLEKASDREGFTALLKRICEEMKLKLEDHDKVVMIDVCPEGYIECGYENCYISISAQTSVVGPGFHAFVCTLIDAILQQASIDLQVNDPTEYFIHRDFEQLKYRYFYRWLGDIQEYVRKHIAQEKDLCICWPQDYYMPAPKKDCVVTPMGYIHKDDFFMRDAQDLAEDFFIWNDLERTARYYRNCAVNLLWKECFFTFSAMNEYTNKIANMIIDYLEAAYDKDNLLPLPMNTYRSLCTVIGRDILIHDALKMKPEPSGYRNGVVTHPFGSWSIPAHGCCETSFDRVSNSLHFMAPYQKQEEAWKWMIKVNGFTFEETIPTFMKMLEHPEGHVKTFQFKNKQVSGKGIIVAQSDCYNIIVQANCDKDMLILECVVKEEKDIAMLKKWCQGVRFHTMIREGLQS